MTEMKLPRAPRGLKTAGRRLWRELVKDLEFGADELAILEQACRVVDRIDALGAAVEEKGLWLQGSTGQPVLNPAIGEQRQQQVALHRLLASLDMPEGEGVASGYELRAKKAAIERWRR